MLELRRDATLLERLPERSVGNGLSDVVTMAAPGVVADSNGSFHPLGDHGELDVLRLADPPQPVECVLGATAGAATENADRLIDHRSASQRTL